MPFRVVIFGMFAFIMAGTLVWMGVKNQEGCTLVPANTVYSTNTVYQCQASRVRFFLRSAKIGPGYKSAIFATDRDVALSGWSGSQPRATGRDRWVVPYALDDTFELTSHSDYMLSIDFVRG